MIEYIIDEDYESVRVDRFLRKHLKNINLSEIYKMLRKGKIKVNNKKISQDYRLVLGDIMGTELENELSYLYPSLSDLRFIVEKTDPYLLMNLNLSKEIGGSSKHT